MVTSPWLIIYTRSSWHGVICCLQIGQWPDSRVPLITLIQYKCALLQGTTFVRRAAKQSTWLSLGRSCLAVSHSLGSSYSFQKKKQQTPKILLPVLEQQGVHPGGEGWDQTGSTSCKESVLVERLFSFLEKNGVAVVACC